MRYNFTVVVSQDDNWYVAKCLENFTASQGKSIEEALNNLREALELYLEDNDDIPASKQTFVTTLEVAV